MKTQWAATLHLYFLLFCLTLILLMWSIGWAPNNAIKFQMGFNSAFKGLSSCFLCYQLLLRNDHFRSLTYWLRLLEARITNGTSRVMPPAVGDSPRHQQSSMIWGQQQSRGSGGQDMSLINGHYTVQNCNSAPSVTSHNKTGFAGGVNSFFINVMD